LSDFNVTFTNFQYDRKHDKLVLKTDNENSELSLGCNDTVFEFDSKGNIIGVEIKHATSRLEISKDHMNEVESFEIFANLLSDNTLHMIIRPKLKSETHKKSYTIKNPLDKYVSPWRKLR
jgi:uncharacterized protein YuzE